MLRRLSAILPAFAFLLLGLAWGGALALRTVPIADPLLDRLEYVSLDWRFLSDGPRPAPDDVIIVEIDDEAIQAAGGYPLARETMARLVRAIADARPRAVAIDVAFLDPGAADADGNLAAALRSAPTVVAAIGRFGEGESAPVVAVSRGTSGALAPTSVVWPIDAIRMATRSGLVNVVTDEAGVARAIPLIYKIGDGVAPALILVAASLGTGAPRFSTDALWLDDRKIALDVGNQLLLRYYGPRGALAHVSAAQFLRPEVPAEVVAGKVAIIGATATAVGDVFATPFGRLTPGVEVLATGIANLMGGGGLVRNTNVRALDAAVTVLMPLIVVLLIAISRPLVGLALAAAVVVGLLAEATVAFHAGYWLAVARPLAAALPIAGGYTAARFVVGRRQTARLELENATLGRFQPPRLVEHFRRDPEFLATPTKQQVAVVFCDLSGFTGLAETLGPEGARRFLSEFQTIVERETSAQLGLVLSYMGDGAMVVFGLPKPEPDDAARALRAMRSLSRAVEVWLANLPDLSKVSLRVGGHFGGAVVSRLGPKHHQNVAATGDTINVASRLLEVGKANGARIVASEDICIAAGLGDGGLAGEHSLEINIRGRTRPIRVRLWL